MNTMDRAALVNDLDRIAYLIAKGMRAQGLAPFVRTRERERRLEEAGQRWLDEAFELAFTLRDAVDADG